MMSIFLLFIAIMANSHLATASDADLQLRTFKEFYNAQYPDLLVSAFFAPNAHISLNGHENVFNGRKEIKLFFEAHWKHYQYNLVDIKKYYEDDLGKGEVVVAGRYHLESEKNPSVNGTFTAVLKESDGRLQATMLKLNNK